MSSLTVLKYPDPKLRRKSKPIAKVSSSIVSLAEDMFETMVAENGIGLAAPQIGELIRLIVMDVPKIDPIDPEKIVHDKLALINPQIVHGEGKIQYEEGCLSCPELIVLVDRNEKIRVKYLDLEGRPCEIGAEQLKAVCIQHEIDHLDGILLVDKLNRIEQGLYKQKRLRVAGEEKELATIL
ncbi:MAG: peptide deformylase [Deltaproteobacteria bacterium]|nr:peptide deformylase [Deltaproteobacteria bacterium]